MSESRTTFLCGITRLVLFNGIVSLKGAKVTVSFCLFQDGGEFKSLLFRSKGDEAITKLESLSINPR